MLLHVFSAGNSGTADFSYGAGAGWGNLTAGWQQGKNQLDVGAVDFRDVLAGFSSRGPANDGRLKPDVCGVGVAVSSTFQNNSYGVFQGTSMSCPGVAGVAAQLVGAYRSLNGGAEAPGTLLKAVLINTADDLGNPGPDFRYGYGRINGLRAVRVLEEATYFRDTLSQGQTRTFTVPAQTGKKQLRVLLHWSDYEAVANARPTLVNNLDLLGYSGAAGSGPALRPWILDHRPTVAQLNANAVQGRDSINNTEQIIIDNPAGAYTFTVNGKAVPQSKQGFWLTYSYVDEGVELTYPLGGEGFVPGETEVLRWDANVTTDGFTLEYSTNGGTSWSSIGTATAAARDFSWTVPSSFATTPSGQVRVRVVRGAQISSSENLTVAGVPANLRVELVCPTETRLNWDAVAGATGYEIFKLVATTMESVGTTAGLAFTVTSVSSTAEQWFSVRATGASGLAGRRAIALRRATGLSNCPGFPPPTITSFTPTSGQVGTVVTLTGTNFTGATAVSFNGTVASSFGVTNATTATATVPAGATTGNVTLATASGTSNGVGFTVMPSAPTITGLNPTSGAMGSSFALTGTALTGTTSVLLGGQPAAFAVNSATSLTVTVPRGASTHRVQVTTPLGTALSGAAFGVDKANTYNFPAVTTGFNGIAVGIQSKPAFADLDGDGLLDLLVGRNNGTLRHYEQGAANSTAFALVTASFSGIDVGDASTPALTDLDGDGLLDLLVGKDSGTLSHYEQAAPAPTLTAVAPSPGGLGQAITLTGINLGSPTALTINGANALAGILSNTGTSLVVCVPVTAAPTGVVSLTTPVGAATAPFAVMAPPGNALAFDGVDDYVSVPHSAAYNITAAITLEAWVRTSVTGEKYITTKSNDSWYLAMNGGGGLPGVASFYLNGPSLSSGGWLYGNTNLADGRWHHVAGTYDGATLRLYVDGALENSRAATGPIPTGTGPVDIGTRQGGNFWQGSLDEVRLWNVARTPAQLRAAAYTPLAGTETGLVRYYNFDQGAPAGNNAGLATLYDLTASAAPATLNTFALTGAASNYVASYALVVPTATVSTARSPAGFTANWTAPAVGTVTGYLLDVSTNAAFTAPIAGSPFMVAAPATSYTLTGLNPTGPYFYRVRALNSALSPADQGAFSNAMGQATPLPVELTAFTATAEGNQAVRLAWATASEKNSAAFDVERSADGRAFAAIGTVAAAGNSTAPRAYQLLDAQLPSGAALLYYRLKHVDLDGTFAYSSVRAVALTGAAAGLALYPNPTPADAATLTGVPPGAPVAVFDALGRLVASFTADAAGTAALVLPAGQSAGVYVVRAGNKALRLTVE